MYSTGAIIFSAVFSWLWRRILHGQDVSIFCVIIFVIKFWKFRLYSMSQIESYDVIIRPCFIRKGYAISWFLEFLLCRCVVVVVPAPNWCLSCKLFSGFINAATAVDVDVDVDDVVIVVDVVVGSEMLTCSEGLRWTRVVTRPGNSAKCFLEL